MMESFKTLPQPHSGQQEQRFRRFLLKCYQKTEATASTTWKHDPVFHKYVENLQDQLANLRNNSTVKIPAGSMERYVKLVEHLSNSLLTPDVPIYCKKLPEIIYKSRKMTQQKPAVLDEGKSSGTNSGYRDYHQIVKQSQFAEMTKARLGRNAEIQDSLTDDLVKLAKGLKEKTKTMASALEDRDTAMEAVTDVLDDSVANAKEARKSAGKTLKRSRLGTCRMLFILLIVGCIFTGMVFFIRITRFVGYKAASHYKSPEL